MKRLVALVILAGLSGCLTDNELPERNLLSPNTFSWVEFGETTWSGPQVYLYDADFRLLRALDANQTYDFASGAAYVHTPTGSSVHILGPVTITEFGHNTEEFVLAQQSALLSPLTEPFIGPSGLLALPYQDQFTLNFTSLPTELEVGAMGHMGDLRVKITSPAGTLYEGALNEGGIGFGGARLQRLQGAYNLSALDGLQVTVDVSAESMDGSVVLFAKTVTPQELPPETAEIGTFALGFQYGQVGPDPMQISVHPDSEWVYFVAAGNATAAVYGPDGLVTAISWAGSARIPAVHDEYAVVASEGIVMVGSDLPPLDFQMRMLPTETFRAESTDAQGPDYNIETVPFDITGTPYKVDVRTEPSGFAPYCTVGGSVQLLGNQTLPYAVPFMGTGNLQPFGVESVQSVRIAGVSNPCDNVVIEVSTFEF